MAEITLEEFVLIADGELVTDSRLVAAHFGKMHKHVLRDVRALLETCPGDFAESNFGLCYEINELQNRRRTPYYRMTKDGFMLLAMGFTGAKALALKIAFINAFNAMAQQLADHRNGLWAQMHKLDALDTASKERASFGSKLMHERKRELPSFERQRLALNLRLQLPLFDD